MRRPLLSMAALVALAFAWGAPLETWLGGRFPAHMVQHMTLVALAAPLIVLALPGIARLLPVSPLVGVVAEFLVVWGWHLPALHAFAFWREGGFLLEQAMFLGAGLSVWIGAFGAREPLAGAGALLLTSMHMTLLGALLTLAGRDLYAEVCGRTADLGAQQWGGLTMLAIGTPVYLFCGLWLTLRGLRRPEEARP